MPTTALIAVSVLGAAASAYGTYQQSRAQKKAASAQRKAQDVRTAAERRQSIRGAQIARAQTIAAAGSAGLSPSAPGSTPGGYGGGVVSPLFSGIGTGTQLSAISRDIERYNSQASQWGGFANIAGGFGGLAGSFIGTDFSGLSPNKATIPSGSTAPAGFRPGL